MMPILRKAVAGAALCAQPFAAPASDWSLPGQLMKAAEEASSLIETVSE